MKSSWLPIITLLYTAAVLTVETHGYPSGAPPTACEDMVPQHFDPPQMNPSPFITTVQNLGGSRYNINLSSQSMTFNGMFIQVRDINENILGAFELGENVKTIDCLGGTMNAATHTSSEAKSSIDVVWDGTGSTGAVSVYYTTCHNVSTYWVKEMVPL